MVRIPSLGQEILWHIESHQYYQKDSPDLVRNVLFDIPSIYLLAFFKGISLLLVRLINSFGL